MLNLRVAISFLTRVPIPLRSEPNLAAAVPWYPTVGAMVGLVVGGAAAGLIHLVPPLVAAAVAVMIGVLVTGAFHEDGLADVADAFAGGSNRAERMRILKDPLHGSYGVAAMCGSIVVRVACVASLGASPAVVLSATVAAHTLGRCAAVALMATVPAAPSEQGSGDGLGSRVARSLSRGRAALGVFTGLAIATIATGWWAGPFAGAALVGTVSVGWLAIRKIGGVTGDVLGTAEQVTEFVVLATATGLASRYTLWWT